MTPRGAGGQLSFRHQRVQRLRRLTRQRTTRDAEGAFVLEGRKLVAEALDSRADIEAVYLAPGADGDLVERLATSGLRVFDLAPGVMERVADTTTPQPVMAVASRLDVPLAALEAQTAVLVCVGVRDPGNLGTVLRSAEAAGMGGVVCCDGSVDVYNPKCVRASAGSLFHTRVVVGGDPLDVLAALGSWGMRRWGTRGVGGTRYDAADLVGPAAIVLGNEARGLAAEVGDEIDEWLTIPMTGRSESLNVGMTAAVLCFETGRQRAAVAR